MNESWKTEAWRILIVVVVTLVLGAGINNYMLTALIGALVYLAWHLRNLARLDGWLSEYRTAEIPEGTGIWGGVYDRLRGMTRHHRQDMDDLHRGLERYQQATKALPEGAVTLGSNDEIELVNEAATSLLGLKDPQDLRSPITNLVRDPQFVRYMQVGKFSEALEIPSPINQHVRMSIRVVPYGEVNQKLLLISDVSRLHKLEEIRRDFIANVSHEMKSPLTVIKGYVESMMDDTSELAFKRKKALSQVDQQTDRMCRVVEDLLQLSSLETSPTESPTPVDMPSLIRSVHAEALELSNSRHDIQLDVDELLYVAGNFNQLYSALSNLVFNAIQYTPEHGEIRIGWRLDQDNHAKFSVRDTGPGIGREHLPRLTERFYRVDTARSRELGGTGLGLAIVKHVLQRHEGSLAIDSELGTGSMFTCVFPPQRIIDKRALKYSA
jgi:two-component system phosphate regulon sensor histidine kinase PhoR